MPSSIRMILNICVFQIDILDWLSIKLQRLAGSAALHDASATFQFSSLVSVQCAVVVPDSRIGSFERFRSRQTIDEEPDRKRDIRVSG